MTHRLSRRAVIGSGGAFLLLGLGGCMTLGDLAGANLEPAVRRLMEVSSERAFARLLADNGYFGDDVARLDLPASLGGVRVPQAAATALRQPLVRQQVLRLVNQAAGRAAANAAPVVSEEIARLSLFDAAAIARGGPTAATRYLEGRIGDRIVTAMAPGVADTLRGAGAGPLGQVLGAAAGVDLPALQREVTEDAARGLWAAIGREESAIRADPDSVDDPLIRRLFGR